MGQGKKYTDQLFRHPVDEPFFVDGALKYIKCYDPVCCESGENRKPLPSNECIALDTSTTHCRPSITSLIGFVINARLIYPNKVVWGNIPIFCLPDGTQQLISLSSCFRNPFMSQGNATKGP